MTKYRLKITRADFEELRRLVLVDAPEEAGAFALAGVSESDKEVDVLVRRVVKVPKELMLIQNEYHLEVSPQAINGLAALCEINKLGAIICHSHPGGGLNYSPSDDHGESRLANTLQNFIPANAPVASLLFTSDAVTGRIWFKGSLHAVMFDEILVIGHNIHRIKIKNRITIKKSALELYDRQVRAFGKEGQEAISQTKVGIVGVGGTGSPIAEQLVRLGVSDIVLIDPDKFSPTNLTRVYGTFSGSIKRSKLKSEHKVYLLASHLKKINPLIQIQAINQSVVLDKAARALLDRDIIFLCTDEHWGRSIVNQIAYQYLIPTINLGVRVTSENGLISHAVGVVDVLRSDKPCLWCKQFLRSERINAESLPSNERKKLLQEGYVDDIDTPAPSVISFTSSVASQAVTLFLHMTTNFMGDSGDISRLSYDFLTGISSRGTTPIDKKCICQKVKGFGNLKPISTIEKILLT